MKLRCSKCKKYKEEKDFGIQAKEENKANWQTFTSMTSNTTVMEVRGGYAYLCKVCHDREARIRYKKNKEEGSEFYYKTKVRYRRRQAKKRYLRDGYDDDEARQIAEKEVPYLWNEEGYECSEEKENWVKVSKGI